MVIVSVVSKESVVELTNVTFSKLYMSVVDVLKCKYDVILEDSVVELDSTTDSIVELSKYWVADA